MYTPQFNDLDEADNDTVKYYDVKPLSTGQPWRHDGIRRQTTPDLSLSQTSSLGLCCLCTACNCDCHSGKTGHLHFNNENFVRYLFDYDLFSIPHNFSRCGYLIAYLKHEGILGNACVLVADTPSLRGPYTRPVVAKNRPQKTTRQDSTHVGVYRSPTTGNLQFRRPVNLIEPLIDVADVRMLMRNYVMSDESRDWLDLRYALQMPTFLIYIKLDGSGNHFPGADFTAMFSLHHLRVIENRASVGRRMAELVAGIREEYFSVPLPNFEEIEQEFSNMQLDRSIKKTK